MRIAKTIKVNKIKYRILPKGDQQLFLGDRSYKSGTRLYGKQIGRTLITYKKLKSGTIKFAKATSD